MPDKEDEEIPGLTVPADPELSNLKKLQEAKIQGLLSDPITAMLQTI